MPDLKALLSVNGEMARTIATHDWELTPLGAPQAWPAALRTTLTICLNNRIPSAIYWGQDFRILFNDAWHGAFRNSAGMVGRPGREIWGETWPLVSDRFEAIMRNGQSLVSRDSPLPIPNQEERFAESYWDSSLTPILGENGMIAGIFNQCQDTTERVLTDRLHRLLVELSDRALALETSADILAASVELIGDRLGMDRVGYGEVIGDGVLRIDACWAGNRVSPLSGAFALDDLGSIIVEALRRGESVGIEDIENDARLRGPGIREKYRAMEAASFAAAPIFRGGRPIALLFTQYESPHHWDARQLAMLRSIANRLWHEMARARTEMALRESERRHRLIFEQARDIIFTADLDQTITACNPATAEAIGLPAEQIVGSSIADFVAPDQFERTSAMLKRKLHEGGTTRYDITVRTVSGQLRQWDVNSALTIDLDGHPIGLHAVVRDITEKHAFDEQQQLLIDELNHRVKNTLALVQGLTLQSFKEDRSLSEGHEAFQARLATLAAAHDLLTQSKWSGATVATLAANATSPYRDREGRITLDGPPVKLAPKAAISLVLALHELSTNAAKYGALSNTEGSVALRWATHDQRRLELEWQERDGPEVHNPPRRGFGLRMLERALASDLDGSVEINFAPQGLICRIAATLPEDS